VSTMIVRMLCACLLACAACARAQAPSTPADARVAYDARAVAALDAGVFSAHHARSGLPYRLLAPSSPAPAGGYPLVLVLHGSGAIGTDNGAQIGAFVKSWALPQAMADFPAYVVAPQFPARTADYTPGPDGILQSHAVFRWAHPASGMRCWRALPCSRLPCRWRASPLHVPRLSA
jgi:predicted peptidase